MKTRTFTVTGQANCAAIAAVLVAQSRWFQVEPLPDGAWCFTTKNEPGSEDAIRVGMSAADIAYRVVDATAGTEDAVLRHARRLAQLFLIGSVD